MRLITSLAAIALVAGQPALAQDAKSKARQPKGAPQAAKTAPADQAGGFECKATSVRVSNLPARGPSPVALPGLYARPFSGSCEEAEKRAKAIPSRDTNYVILGRTTPIEMAAGLCQSGAGNRSFARSEMKPMRGGFVRPAARDVRESVVITSAMKYTFSATGGGFSYQLTGSCKPTPPVS